jgi:hypothetical protein
VTELAESVVVAQPVRATEDLAVVIPQTEGELDPLSRAHRRFVCNTAASVGVGN